MLLSDDCTAIRNAGKLDYNNFKWFVLLQVQLFILRGKDVIDVTISFISIFADTVRMGQLNFTFPYSKVLFVHQPRKKYQPLVLPCKGFMNRRFK